MSIERGTPPIEQLRTENKETHHQPQTEQPDGTVPKIDSAVPQIDVESIKKRDETAIAKIRASLGLEHNSPEKSNEQPVITMDELRKKAQEEGGMILYHGGLPDDTTIEKIDLDRFGSQQNKKGRTYGGFYLTDESSKGWTEKYAQERNGNIHGFLVADSSRTMEIQGRDIDRLSQEQREELAKEYDLIKGKDLLGRTQYVLLNKGVVNGLGVEKVA